MNMLYLTLILVLIGTIYGENNSDLLLPHAKKPRPISMSRNSFTSEEVHTKQHLCGQRNPDGVGHEPLSFFEEEAEFGELPWMVAVLREKIVGDEKEILYQCGGSLVKPNVVVTAAHCVYGRVSATYRIRAGEWNTKFTEEPFPHIERYVIEIIVHEEYNKHNLHNDIALLKFNPSIENAPHINTICLPIQDQDYLNKNCIVSGWGKDTFGGSGTYQSILKKIELKTIPLETCQEKLGKARLGRRFVLHDSFMCAGGETSVDTCKGDGGSPLVCPIDGKSGYYYQAGIVSWGIKCGEPGIPGVYVNVAKFRDWIDQKLE